MSILDNIQKLLNSQGKSQSELTEYLNIKKSIYSDWKSGRLSSYNKYLPQIAEFFGVSVDYLVNGKDDFAPRITSDYVTFPVIGEVGAGYSIPAVEDWSGDTVDIPLSYLKGRQKEEFFVLKVTGDSMYPKYQDGDKVLVLRQSTLNHSGQVGVIVYDGDIGTLKRIEYAVGEDWLRLVPINPNYPPKKIKDAELEQCTVLGIPKLLIREIEE
ncbi:MAG: LexA family transcriptional regulator [Oscillospiraceae bacterium]|nr:LexA family transcriptional regulator [Candidatus Ruminococcus equi]